MEYSGIHTYNFYLGVKLTCLMLFLQCKAEQKCKNLIILNL